MIIDALDEAGSKDERAELLRVLSNGVTELPAFLKILVVSRPEGDIAHRFDHKHIHREELRVDSETGRADVAAFIRSRLGDTRQQRSRKRDRLQG